jgi:hypothetical protein
MFGAGGSSMPAARSASSGRWSTVNNRLGTAGQFSTTNGSVGRFLTVALTGGDSPLHTKELAVHHQHEA